MIIFTEKLQRRILAILIVGAPKKTLIVSYEHNISLARFIYIGRNHRNWQSKKKYLFSQSLYWTNNGSLSNRWITFHQSTLLTWSNLSRPSRIIVNTSASFIVHHCSHEDESFLIFVVLVNGSGYSNESFSSSNDGKFLYFNNNPSNSHFSIWAMNFDKPCQFGRNFFTKNIKSKLKIWMLNCHEFLPKDFERQH